MIDFIKALVIDIEPQMLLNNPNLNFCSEVNISTGELRSISKNGRKRTPFQNAYYKGLEFRIYDTGLVILSGSLHKYWNDGQHNYNDFTYDAIIEVLEDIEMRFGIKACNLQLKQLEIGINFIPPHPTLEILNHCFIHRGMPFKWIHVADEGRYIQVEHSQYIIKVYDKAHHYRKKGFDVPEREIMRFEIKYRKMEKLKTFGIATLQDFIDFPFGSWWEVLNEEWRAILFYDFTIRSNHPSLLNYKNKLYWLGLLERESKSAYYKHRRILSDLVNQCSELVASNISFRMMQKSSELLGFGDMYWPEYCRGTSFDRDAAV